MIKDYLTQKKENSKISFLYKTIPKIPTIIKQGKVGKNYYKKMIYDVINSPVTDAILWHGWTFWRHIC